MSHICVRTAQGGWIDTNSGVECVSQSEGKELNYSATLWEVPVFAKSGSMIPLALQVSHDSQLQPVRRISAAAVS